MMNVKLFLPQCKKKKERWENRNYKIIRDPSLTKISHYSYVVWKRSKIKV